MSLTLGRGNGQRARDTTMTADQDVAARDASSAPAAARTVPSWAIVSAALSPVVLTAGWLVAGAVQPTSYSPVRETVSVMAGYEGTDRWIMTTAMVAAGACYLITAAGLSGLRPSARLVLLVAGLSSIGVATSPEPASGPSLVHLTWTVVGAVAITVWPAVVGWRRPPWATVNPRAVLTATAIFIVLLGWVLIEVHGGDALGAAERSATSIPTTWPFVVALSLRRRNALGEVGISEES